MVIIVIIHDYGYRDDCNHITTSSLVCIEVVLVSDESLRLA